MKTYSRKKPGDSQEVILHLNELCRLCMAKEDVLVPIFNEDDAVPLTLRIMACVQLEVRIILLLILLLFGGLMCENSRCLKEMDYPIRFVTRVDINWKNLTHFVKNANNPIQNYDNT